MYNEGVAASTQQSSQEQRHKRQSLCQSCCLASQLRGNPNCVLIHSIKTVEMRNVQSVGPTDFRPLLFPGIDLFSQPQRLGQSDLSHDPLQLPLYL